MRHIIGRVLPFAVAGILGAGCGSSDSTTGASTSISKMQAAEYAHAVNLVASDMPGATVVSQEHAQGRESQASVEFERCAGGVNPNSAVVDIDSATLKLGGKTVGTSVRSSAVVLPTAALAARNFASAQTSRGRACLERLLPRALERTSPTEGVHISHPEVAFLPSLLPSGQDSFGVRTTVTLVAQSAGGKRISVPSYTDVYDVLAGPAEVNLTTNGISKPVPAATERRLLSILYNRAKTHRL